MTDCPRRCPRWPNERRTTALFAQTSTRHLVVHGSSALRTMTPGLPCLVKGNRLSLAPAMPRPTVNPAFVKAVTANSRLCATGCGLV